MTPDFDRLTKQMVDDGRLIEAGWLIMRVLTMPADAPEPHVREMRLAYMAGAQHLFSSIMVMLDPGTEATERDLKRMDLISKEMDDVYAELKAHHITTKPS